MIPKYRAKRLDNNEWVYGMPLHLGERCWIANGFRLSYFDEDSLNTHLTMNQFEVDPATVGQWTGLKDKNGIDIYEGDIVKTYFGEKHQVKYNNKHAFFAPFLSCGARFIEIIGNIHENKEMVKP